MAAYFNRAGKKGTGAGYYLHIEPGASFAAAGIWMPEGDGLSKIRQEIDYNSGPLLKILKSASFKKYFKGFDEDGKLKLAPKGFEKEHPQLELLKNKHFIVSYPLSDADLTNKKNAETVIAAFKAMYPLMVYLRAATHS